MDRVENSNLRTQLDLEGLPRHVALVAGAAVFQMGVGDTVVIATSDQADGVGRVTLPSVAEGVGKLYYISAPTGLAAGDISVYEKETGAEFSGGDLDANGDHLLLFSDGTMWKIVLNGVAA